MTSDHRRRRSRIGLTPERRDHESHHPKSDEERKHLAAMYARDAAKADTALSPYKEPRVIKGHRFIFYGVHLQESTLLDALYEQFEARGLCAVVSIEDMEMPAAVLYVDERVPISEISHLTHSVKLAVDQLPHTEQVDLGLLTDQALIHPDYELLRSISQEYVAS